MTTPDSLAALVAACRRTIARIKDPTVRAEYTAFLRQRVRAERDGPMHALPDHIRPEADEDEALWLDLNTQPWVRRKTRVLEVEGMRFAVVPMLTDD